MRYTPSPFFKHVPTTCEKKLGVLLHVLTTCKKKLGVETGNSNEVSVFIVCITKQQQCSNFLYWKAQSTNCDPLLEGSEHKL